MAVEESGLPSEDFSPLLPPPAETLAAAPRRRFLLFAAGASLLAGTVAAAAALRAPGAAERAQSPHSDVVQDGFATALVTEQEYSGGGSYVPVPVPAPAAGAGAAPTAYGASGYTAAGGAAVAGTAYGNSGYASAGPAAAVPSLYCYALIMPFGNEVELLQYQLQERISLFACNDYQIFSNSSFSLGPDSAQGGAPLVAIPIGMSMEVPHGGRWGTALNTDVFVKLWQVVAQQGRWQSNEWSVKLDADAVFLPERLRAMLRKMPVPGAKYINNCKWGLHGPIEVISRAGFAIYSSQSQLCAQIREDAMAWQPVHWNEKMLRWTGTDKDHSFGEDQYLRRCLRQLQVTVVNEYKMLDELACGGDPKHTGCVGDYVTYHPFKEVEQYKTCLAYTRLEPR